MINKNKYGSITIALLIGILIISVCSSISISMAGILIGIKSDLNKETLKTEISFLLESYANEFRETGKITSIMSFDENLNESNNLDSSNTQYVIEYEIIEDEKNDILSLKFKNFHNDEILDTRTVRRMSKDE